MKFDRNQVNILLNALSDQLDMINSPVIEFVVCGGSALAAMIKFVLKCMLQSMGEVNDILATCISLCLQTKNCYQLQLGAYHKTLQIFFQPW